MSGAIRTALSHLCLLTGILLWPAMAFAMEGAARLPPPSAGYMGAAAAERHESEPYIAGTWRYPSGSTVEIWEYLDQFTEGNQSSSAFIGRYLAPADAVASGGARPGMYSLVGARRGRRIEGKVWLFTTDNPHCYPDGQARDFAGEIGPDGGFFTIAFGKVVLRQKDCSIAERLAARMTATRLLAAAAMMKAPLRQAR